MLEILKSKRSDVKSQIDSIHTQIKSEKENLNLVLNSLGPASQDTVEVSRSILERKNEDLVVILKQQHKIEQNGIWLANGAKPPIPEESPLFLDTLTYAEDAISDWKQTVEDNKNKTKKLNDKILEVQKKIKTLDKILTDSQVIERHKKLETLLEASVSIPARRRDFKTCGMSWAEIFALNDYSGVGFFLMAF